MTSTSLYVSHGGGTGLYNLSGGTLSSGYTYLGDFGNGTFNQTGGTHIADGMEVGYDDEGNGTYLISGNQSVLSSHYIRVGYHADGHFVQSGGLVSTTDLSLGQTSSAEYLMSGGSLSVSQRLTFSDTARGDYNRFIQTAGSVIVGSSTAAGTFNLNEGSYSIGGGSSSLTIFGNGTLSSYGFFTQSGGAARVTGSIAVSSNANYLLNGGSLTAGTITIDNGGSLSWQGGSLSVGTVIVNGMMTLSPVASSSQKTLRAQSLSIDNTTGKLDLADNKLVVDYTNASTVLNSLRTSLHASSLFSSLADARHGIGYADNAVLHRASFGDQTFTVNQQTEVLAGLTYNGDANLDGKVDVLDLGLLASHWQQSGYWMDGDFNYDGSVNVVDLGLLASNWQAGAGGTQSFAEALATFDLAQTPEPTALGLCAFGLLLQRLRRAA